MSVFVHEENVLGAVHRYLSTGTEGGPAVIEITLVPGAGAPPHDHAHEDEMFYGLEGAVTFHMEGVAEPVVLRAGGQVHAPRGRWHRFHNEGAEDARMLAVVLPGRGLCEMFAELAGVAMPPDPAVVGAITARYGVHLRAPG